MLKCNVGYIQSTEALYSPNGKYIVTTALDAFGSLQVLEAETGHCVKKLYGHTGGVNSLLFSSEGKKLISTSEDKTICIWDAESWKQLHSLKGHTMSVRHAEFNSNGDKIVSVSYDNTIRIWDVESGICLQTLEGHTDTTEIVRYCPDDRRIISVSWDGTAKIWDYPPLHELVDESRKRFKSRQLTHEERRKFHLE